MPRVIPFRHGHLKREEKNKTWRLCQAHAHPKAGLWVTCSTKRGLTDKQILPHVFVSLAEKPPDHQPRKVGAWESMSKCWKRQGRGGGEGGGGTLDLHWQARIVNQVSWNWSVVNCGTLFSSLQTLLSAGRPRPVCCAHRPVYQEARQEFRKPYDSGLTSLPWQIPRCLCTATSLCQYKALIYWHRVS